MSLQCVVVGVDGSDESLRAAAFAVDVLRGTPGRLVVVAAFLARPELRESDNDELRDETTARTGAAVELANAAGVGCKVIVGDGDPQAVLEGAARDEGAQLIVVGTRGRGAVARALLGSVATHLTTYGAFPVAVVH